MKIYKTTIFRDANNVIGLSASEKTQHIADTTDFDNNFKASATLVGDITLPESRPVLFQDWTALKTIFTNPSDLFYVEVNTDRYEIYFNISPSASVGSYGPISVGITATEIVPANPDRIALIITVKDNVEVFLGLDDGVTTANGTQYKQDDVLEIDQVNLYTGAIFGIVASGSADVRFMEI